jgi:hypothetical protein
MTPELRPGLVLRYPYLWARQAQAGETEGRKTRPVCLALTLGTDEGVTRLVLLAITSRPPGPDRNAVAVPDIERHRAGLAGHPAAWVIVDEYNFDIAERSFYLDPSQTPLGAFSPSFLRRVTQAFRQALAGNAVQVPRAETRGKPRRK